METVKIKIALIAFVVFCSLHSFAQCGSEDCAKQLDSEFTFLKTLKADMAKSGKKGYVEISNVFSKGNTYMIKTCTGESEKSDMIVQLFDKSRKLLATNYDKKNDKFYSAMQYKCAITSIYYLRFKTKSGSGCGSGVLGFK